MIKSHSTIVLSLILCLFFVVSLYACKKSENSKEISEIFAMDTVITLTAYGDNSKAAIDAGKKEIKRLEKLFSVTDEESEIWKINHNPNTWIQISDEVRELITKSIDISQITQGKFDITLHNVITLWGFTTSTYSVPPKTDIEKALSTTGYENIEFDKGGRIKIPSTLKLDLGGVAKGYICDKVAKEMEKAGIEHGIISLGGNVKTIGKSPENKTWDIAIMHPDKKSYLGAVKCLDVSAVTSGAYQRNFTKNGKTYHHIIDPDTGYPSDSDVVSITIFGKDGTLCDGLSTALFIGGSEYCKNLYKSKQNFDFIILTKNDNLIISSGLKDNFTLDSSHSNLKIEYI